jgi:hypothetical protein
VEEMDIDDVFEMLFCVMFFVLVVLVEFVFLIQPKIMNIFFTNGSVSLEILTGLLMCLLIFLAGLIASINQAIFCAIYTSIFWIIGFVHYFFGWLLRIRKNGVIFAIRKMIKTPYSLEEEEETLIKRFQGMTYGDMDDTYRSLNSMSISHRFKEFFHFDLF